MDPRKNRGRIFVYALAKGIPAICTCRIVEDVRGYMTAIQQPAFSGVSQGANLYTEILKEVAK